MRQPWINKVFFFFFFFCVILSENLPSSLKAQGHTTNHTKRKWDYKAYSQEEACGMTLFI